MGISRQSAQRLVSLAVAERLIKVRLDHPIAACLELADAFARNIDLKHVEVVPSDPVSGSTTVGIAEAAAAEIERWLKKPDPIVLAVGTGRTLKAAVDQLPAIECPQASHRVADRQYRAGRLGCLLQRHLQHGRCGQGAAFPDAAAGAGVTSAEERETLHAQQLVRSTLEMSAQADVTFVGIGELGIDGPLCLDGFSRRTR
jgi:DNA-binding transcriptional regulator LsrR (DeoR family)